MPQRREVAGGAHDHNAASNSGGATGMSGFMVESGALEGAVSMRRLSIVFYPVCVVDSVCVV